MKRVALREARRQLGDLIRAAEAGESVTLTRRGRDVACIVPAEPARRPPVPDLTEFRASLPPTRGRSLLEELLEMRREERL